MNQAWSRALLLTGSLLGGCESCASDTLATVDEVEARVERDHAEREEEWEPAEVGAELSFGDGLRTGADASALLGLEGGGRVRVGPSAQIRLGRSGAPGTLGLDVLAGAVEIETEDALRIETELGALTLEAGGRARLGAADLEVLLGSVRLEREGETRTLEEGDQLSLELGELAFEEEEEDVPAIGAAPPEIEDAPDAPGWRVRAEGEVRLRADDEEWTTLGPEAADASGATVAVGAGSADVSRGGDSVALAADSLAQIGDAGGALTLEEGSARVEATQGRVVVQVPGGAIVVRGDAGEASAEITIDEDGGARVEAERGLVLVRHGEDEETVAPGESADVGEPPNADSAIATDAPAEVRVSAGESFSVHHPRPPAIIEMALPEECDGQAVLQVTGRRGGRAVAVDGVLRVSLRRGRHRYRVRCAEGEPVVARGRVRVVRDSATAPLPRTPPSTTIEADGRRYTILYQNLLPEVRVRTGGQSVEVRSGRRTRRYRVSGGVARLPSGALREGTHEVRVVGSDAPPTTVAVRFDNAARTVALREPRDGSFSAGEQVTVSGVTVHGWNVSVAGQPIAQDRSQRFTETVQVPAGRGGFAVRLAHPRRGVRYYVRRAREAE